MPLPEAPPGLAGRCDVLSCHRHLFYLGPIQKRVQMLACRLATATFHDNGGLEDVGERHAARMRVRDRRVKAFSVRLVKEDGKDRRTVHDHFGRPRSS